MKVYYIPEIDEVCLIRDLGLITEVITGQGFHKYWSDDFNNQFRSKMIEIGDL